MVTSRMPARPPVLASLILALAALVPADGFAQSWPSDSGPTGDYLRATTRQFERLAPAPIESEGRGERAVPDMPITDVPGGSVDVGIPVVTPLPMDRTAPRTRAPRREAYRPVQAEARPRRPAPSSREGRLERELARQNERIRALERQIQQGR